MPHHDLYDSRTSQSKGLTAAEVLHAKASLLAYINDAFANDTVSINISIKGDYNRLSAQQQEQLLANAIEALNLKYPVQVLSTSRGSILYRLKINCADAVTLLQAFDSGNLKESGVLAVSETCAPLKDVAFSSSFARYAHGIQRNEAARTVLMPDSAMFFDGDQQTSPQRAAFGLFLRQLNPSCSLLVITDTSAAVTCALPLSHADLALDQGANPYQALVALVDNYGIPLRLDGSSRKLRHGERIALPYNMSEVQLIRFLESRAEEVMNRHNYELIGIFEQGVILSNSRFVQLLFALSKPDYTRSLKRLGLNLKQSSRGRFISLKPKKY